MLVFFLIFFTTHYVSLGSILGYLTVFVCAVILGQIGDYNFPAGMNTRLLTEYYIVMAFLTVMAICRHKENIKRLVEGNERKTYLKSKPEVDVDNNPGNDRKQKEA